MEAYMKSTQFCWFDRRRFSDMRAVKTAAACGSAAGMRAVAMMAVRARDAARVAANPDVENPDIAEARYATLLAPFLGGALSAGFAAYHVLKHSNEWIKGALI
ncbi:hypothetical protein E2562_022301 [Oryza meyeriana var. granulata]|uniref:Uncharacterized protein n=1 Tax=Oryza meyeriana var. granulata TaxID=110450 RepID=A0A6G1D687_9ORYZ|nr:hypothetical protein E2562_022301 [Oryza meyeriana var. granulata]